MPPSTMSIWGMNLRRHSATSTCIKSIETIGFGVGLPLGVSVIRARQGRPRGSLTSSGCRPLEIVTFSATVSKVNNHTRFLRWHQTITCPHSMTLLALEISKTASTAQEHTLTVQRRNRTRLGSTIHIRWVRREILGQLSPCTVTTNSQILALVSSKSSNRIRQWWKPLKSQIRCSRPY